MNRYLATLTLAALLAASMATAAPLAFERERIGTGAFESACAADIDRDGHMDIVSGEYWYAGPDFQKAHKICEIRYVDTYYDDFSNYPMDVNGDGWTDIVTGGYWGLKLQWRENPADKDTEWTTHDVAEVGSIERSVFYDLDGDGVPEVMPVTNPVHIFRLERDASGKGAGSFKQYTIEAKGGGGHGFGCGDINGDGVPDLIFTNGWFEAPKDPFDMTGWVWHGELRLDSASVPVLVHDVNEDGKNDIIYGNAHGYGLWWIEQGGKDGKRTWTKHDIEMERSQYHDMLLVDIDKDGGLELLTGKRYHAHNGHDPGAEDPVGVYYFEINGGDFKRVTLDYGPPDRASGLGIYAWAADVDGNGWIDVIAPGKEGLCLFRNRGPLESD